MSIDTMAAFDDVPIYHKGHGLQLNGPPQCYNFVLVTSASFGVLYLCFGQSFK